VDGEAANRFVVSIFKSEASPQEVARKHGPVAEVEEWRKFVAAAGEALRSYPQGAEGQRERGIKRLREKVGELVRLLPAEVAAYKIRNSVA
jgi:hypothetical protein